MLKNLIDKKNQVFENRTKKLFSQKLIRKFLSIFLVGGERYLGTQLDTSIMNSVRPQNDKEAQKIEKDWHPR